MTYWTNLANIYNAKLVENKEVISADTTPVQKAQRLLQWPSSLGDFTLKYFHNEHSLSHNNSTYSELSIELNSCPGFEFKLTKLDFLEKLYARIWNRKDYRIFDNFQLKSSDLNKSKRIIDTLQIEKIYFESIELIENAGKSKLVLITREDFVRQQNAETYIDFLLKIGF